MSPRRRFLVALLLEGNVAREIDGLRRALKSTELERIAPHVTLVAPVNVVDPDVPAILDGLRTVAAASQRFELTVGPTGSFPSPTNVLYLALGGDLGALNALHAALGALPLAPRRASRDRPFVPHVTLARLAPGELEAASRLLAGYEHPATFVRLSLLEQRQQAAGHPWDHVADWPLGPPSVVGRGGREVAFVESTKLDPSLQALFDAEWELYGREEYGMDFVGDQPLAVVARVEDRPVGFAIGRIVDSTSVHIDLLIVRSGERNLGIGGQLLGHLEGLARARGLRRLRLTTIAGGPAERFYARHGYRVVATIPHVRQDRDFSAMERLLSG